MSKKTKYPVLAAFERDDKGNLSVWCHHCVDYHNHGNELGHVNAHCFNEDSPFVKTGYVLKKVKHKGRQLVLKER